MKVDTGLLCLGLDGLTAFAACVGPSDLQNTAVGKRQSVIIHGTQLYLGRAEAAMAP